MKLIYNSRQAETGGVYTFRFDPLEPLTWQAGQSIKLELPAGYDTHERRFTIVSAPYEKHISITTRISDSLFKQALSELQSGQEVDAYGIEGTFIWPDSLDGSIHKLLCASGIGITPFYSMIKQLDYDGRQIDATLLYASRTDCFTFADELRALRSKHSEFKIVFLPGQRLSHQIIHSEYANFAKQFVYLSGPSAMVDEIGSQLLSAGLTDGLLMRDWFAGKNGWDSF